MNNRKMAVVLFFFNDTATTEIYTFSLHDALPISSRPAWCGATFTGRRVSPRTRPPMSRRDRKSTRLNSSHDWISLMSSSSCKEIQELFQTIRHPVGQHQYDYVRDGLAT